MKSKVITLFVFIILVLVGIYFYGQKTPNKLKIGDTILKIEIAETIIEKTRGLSGRTTLGEDEAMLFIFEKEGFNGIWMKDMNFSIDIVWLDKNKKIIHLEKNVSPQTYPKIFNSPKPSLFVLEIAAGFLIKNNINIGDMVAF